MIDIIVIGGISVAARLSEYIQVTVLKMEILVSEPRQHVHILNGKITQAAHHPEAYDLDTDPTFVIERDPSNPNFIWCTGQGRHGFQTTPAALQLLSDTISGQPTELDKKIIAPLSPKRLIN